MKFPYLSIFIAMILTGAGGIKCAFADMWTVTSSPSGCGSVAGSADGVNLVTSTSEGIFISHNSGQTWSTSSNGIWGSVSCSADGTVLVALQSSTSVSGPIFVSTNGGSSWNQTSAPSNNWTAAACSANGSQIVAVGYNAGIYISTNDGVSWNQALVPTNLNWRSIASSADGSHLAALSTVLYTSADGGQTWVPRQYFSNDADSIASSADGNQLVVADYFGVFISTNAGVTGFDVGSPYGCSFVGSSALGDTLVAVSGNYLVKSTDYGNTWVEIESTNLSNYGPTTATLSADGTRIAAVEDGLIFTWPYTGFTWALSNPNTIQTVASSADGSKLIGAYEPYPYTSSDGGATWTQQTNAPNGIWLGLACSADGSKVVAKVSNGNTGIYISDNSGVTWAMTTNQAANINHISTADGTKLAGYGNGSISTFWTSKDSGMTWLSGNISNNPEIQSMACSANGSVLLALCYNQGIYLSPDWGTTWTLTGAPIEATWNKIACSTDGSIIVATTSANSVFISTNGGSAWFQATNAPTGHSWTSLAVSGAGNTILTTTRDGWIFVSTDTGASWSAPSDPINYQWMSGAISGDGTHMVVAGIGGAYRLTNSFSAAPFTGISNVVFVMMENRSFDHFLGWLPGANGLQQGLVYEDRLGIDHLTYALAPDFQGCDYYDYDPDHSYSGGKIAYDNGQCDGWLQNPSNDLFCIGYYRQSDLSFLGAIATNWTVCDNYFAPVMAETQPNRIYQHTAQTDALTNRVFSLTDILTGDKYCKLRTIWDSLESSNVSCGYFTDSGLNFILNDGVPGMLSLWGPLKYSSISYGMGDFYADCHYGTLPAVSFVDPILGDGEYVPKENDDHPFSDVRDGEAFLANVYNAVISSPNWQNTVLVITFDEWGGFFDHVPPQPAQVTTPAEQAAYAAAGISPGDPMYGMRGFRVPCIVISPFARRGYVAHSLYDHTSVLKMIDWRWNLPPLTARDATANNLAGVLDFGHPNLEAEPINVPPGPFTQDCHAVNIAATSNNNGKQVQLNWNSTIGNLQSAASPAGPWNNVTNSAPPYIISPGQPSQFFRIIGK